MKTGDRRALLLGAGMVAGALLTLRGVPAAWDVVRNTTETLSARTELLARAELDVLQADALEDSGIVIRNKVVGLAPRLLEGTREADATADLTLRLKLAARDNRVRVERTSSLPDSGHRGGLRPVALRAVLEGDSRGTVGLIGALARGPVALATTDLTITAANPSAPGAVAELLKIELTVRGWYLSRPESQR
jgi:hypothetical protein